MVAEEVLIRFCHVRGSRDEHLFWRHVNRGTSLQVLCMLLDFEVCVNSEGRGPSS